MRRLTRTVCAALLLALLLGSAAAQRGRDGTLRLLYWQAVSTLNPYLSNGNKDLFAASVVLEPLVRYDPDGNQVPWLAAELPTVENGGVAADHRSIRWTLRPGLLWSDGSPLRPEDFEFTWRYCTTGAGCVAQDAFVGIERFEIHDELRFTIHFEQPKPMPYTAFVGMDTPVLQAAQFAGCLGEAMLSCSEQNFAPIGTGPFAVSEMRPNDVVTFHANPHYREADKPAFAEMVLKGGGDAAAAARAVLQTAEADWAWNLLVAPEVLAQMEAAGFGQITRSYGTLVERILFQSTNVHPSLGEQRGEVMGGANPHPILSDLRVRRALAMAIDLPTLVEVGFGATARPTCNLIPAPAAYASTANEGCEAQDIEGANALLDEAGWLRGVDGIRSKDGLRLSLVFQTSVNPVRQDFQTLIQGWWREIGVETELRAIDAGVFFGNDPGNPDTFAKFWADVQMFAYGLSGTDFQSYFDGFLCANPSQRENAWLGGNVSRYCNPAFDAMAAELAQAADPEERARLVRAMNDLLVQDVAIVPLVHRADVSARANDLMGTAKNSWDSELWNIADWHRAR